MMNNKELETPEIKPGAYQRESIPLWFTVGSILVTAWVAYYLYRFWGGLGPGIPQ
jgi:hypothetical protein